MKNNCKKLIIMFVMVLGIMGGYSINAFANDDFEIGVSNLNGTTENSAKVGELLTNPEIGWKRYDDNNSKIVYSGDFISGKTEDFYDKTFHIMQNDGKVTFYFYGSKLRLLSGFYYTKSQNIQVNIDGNAEKFSEYIESGAKVRTLNYEKTNLPTKLHKVDIYLLSGDSTNFELDAIDIDDYGYLTDKFITLNNSSLIVKKENSKELTAITTPEAVNVVWSSSDESIATVAQDGKVTGIKEGTCIITATIEGTDIKDTCEVTVTKGDVQEPTGDGNLYIEMVDGNIKQAQNLDVADFIKWFKNRDLDDTESPIYKIKNAKGNTEYLVHDKIVAFELR